MRYWTAAIACLLAAACPGQGPQAQTRISLRLPPGRTVPALTRSPDGRYGVTVPSLELWNEAPGQNQLVDLTTGRVLATLCGRSAPLSANHVDVEAPNWSADGSLLLWRVAGKWSPWALVLVRIRHGRALWQRDILRVAQQAILTRTKRVRPRQYRAAVRQNEGNGFVYPDGFTVDVAVNVEPGGRLSLPLKVTATLTSNPKRIPDYPKEAQLDSVLSAFVTADGKFVVTRFALTSPRKD